MIILMMKEILLEILLYNKEIHFMKIDQINSLISIRNFMLSSANEMSNLPKDKRNQAISKVKEIDSLIHETVLNTKFESLEENQILKTLNSINVVVNKIHECLVYPMRVITTVSSTDDISNLSLEELDNLTEKYAKNQISKEELEKTIPENIVELFSPISKPEPSTTSNQIVTDNDIDQLNKLSNLQQVDEDEESRKNTLNALIEFLNHSSDTEEEIAQEQNTIELEDAEVKLSSDIIEEEIVQEQNHTYTEINNIEQILSINGDVVEINSQAQTISASNREEFKTEVLEEIKPLNEILLNVETEEQITEDKSQNTFIKSKVDIEQKTNTNQVVKIPKTRKNKKVKKS